MSETINENKSIKEIGQNEFVNEVIEASKEKLIVVDFWAPWCGPCKDLGPRLEKIISQTKGKAKLMKINIDENQELAAQLQIQSIPAVFAFKNGRIANGFQGALPESEIIKFVEKLLGEKLEGALIEKINLARDFLNQEDYNKSLDLIEEIITSGPQNEEAIEILIKSKLGLNQIDEVKEIIQSLEEKLKKNKNIISAINAYDLYLNAKNSGSLDDLNELVKKDPLNIENNKKLSDLYFSEKNYSKAFGIILELFKKSKNNNRNEIKKILFNYFEVLGNTHEQTKQARRKLSSLIFS